MANEAKKGTSNPYCPRFGTIAVEMGFITVEQLKEAISEQVEDYFVNKPHRLIGKICFDKGWMTNEQVETVLDKHYKNKKRGEGNSIHDDL